MDWILPENITEEYLESDDVFGFIYRIDFDNDFWYIGKKQTHSYRKIKKGARSKLIIKPSDWKRYNSSSIHVLNLIARGVEYQKEIIEVTDRRNLEYLETKCLFQHNALEDEYCLNQNIAGKYFKGKI